MTGETKEIRVLASLAKPATMAQLAERLGISLGRVSLALKALGESRLVFVSGWAPSARTGHWGPAIYSLGQGVTPPRPPLPTISVLLAAMPGTVREISKKTGLHEHRVQEIINTMGGLTHVSNRVRQAGTGGRLAAVYSQGAGKPQPKPSDIAVNRAIRAQSPLFWAINRMVAGSDVLTVDEALAALDKEMEPGK